MSGAKSKKVKKEYRYSVVARNENKGKYKGKGCCLRTPKRQIALLRLLDAFLHLESVC
jgi:hypothetical protein